MRALALATDYDGTIATAGSVEAATLRALERLAASGRKLVLVTGRPVDDLERVFAAVDRFDRVVAENGAVLYAPASRELRVLAQAPPRAFVEALRARGVAPLSVGRAIVATTSPHQAAVTAAIRELGLDLHVELNKGAVMALPADVTKRNGLAAALAELRLSPRDVVGVGDAENDLSFLSCCGWAACVANALPEVQARSHSVTAAPDGAGVVQLVERMLAST